jgi:zinc transporter ZupT
VKSHNAGTIDKSLFAASKILERTMQKQQSIDLSAKGNISVIHEDTHEQKEPLLEDKIGQNEVEIIDIQDKHHHFNPTSNMTPYILLVALSIHGLFEGSALGVQTELKDTLFLCIAILAHKWAESFALGMSFYKSNTEIGTYVRMIILFAIFTPLGITIGMILSGTGPLIQGIFLAVSSGTFLYVSASEVIVEEFAITRYRYQKYFLYLCGGILVGLLSYLEVIEERSK